MRSGLICLGFILSTACSGSIDVGPGAAGGGGLASSGAGAPGAGTGSGGASTSGGAGTVAGSLACTDETPLPTWPATSGCTAGTDLPIVGTWKGYIENQIAPFDDITLVISGASVAGGLCGTVALGTGAALPIATDPNLGYPDPSAGPTKPEHPLVPGFEYALLDGQTDGTRVRFSLGKTEPWKGWCELQTSYTGGQDVAACNCQPNWAQKQTGSSCVLLAPAGFEDMSVNCAKMVDCDALRGSCQCNSSGCTASMSAASSGMDFDLRFTGDQGEGSTTAGSNRVYFTRQ